ncbi:MAG: ASKHA domain-containing protein [Armatimonadia bacterium]
MSPSEFAVTFTPGGETVTVPAGELLLNAAVAAGVPITAPCGGHGRCAKCLVRIERGQTEPPDDHEREHLTEDQLSAGWRLACRTRILSDIDVYVAPESEVVCAKPLEDELIEDVAVEPAVRQIIVELPKPSLEDQRSDFVRLRDALADQLSVRDARLHALWRLPQVLRENDFRLAATIRDDLLVEVSPANGHHPLGVAVDIGTTTVVAYLVDLVTGQHLGSGTAHNPQAQHGADVISRTEYSKTTPDGLARLQREAVGVVNQVVAQALECIDAGPERIHEMTVVGNTCMHHLFLGLDPRYIAEAPYIPVNSAPISVAPRELGVRMSCEGRIFCLPIVAGYVGADTIGVITATRLTDSPDPVIAVDIGTNGEVALWSGERLVCASCAAGPAFEGAQIEHGMRAAPGAISAVEFVDGDLRIETINNKPALGLCGSGLFDAMAVVLQAGLVDMMGRMADADKARSLPDKLAARLEGEANTRRIILVSADESGTGEPVYFTQRDVRELQLAKGAVRAAVELLLKECGLKADDLSAVLLAGAFGNYLRPESAVRMGLLPAMGAGRIRGVGNAAGAGAMMALLSLPWRQHACDLASRAEHLELAQRADFQHMFMETMLFV